MRKALIAAAAGMMVLGAVGTAAAEDFASEGQLIIGADRLWGYHMYKVTDKEEMSGQTTETETSSNQLNFLWGTTGDAGNHINPGSIPRLALDYSLGGLTIGGSLGYISRSGSSKQTKPTESASTDSPTFSAFAIAPRVGYALPVSDGMSLWPRGGFTYYSSTTESKNAAANTSSEVTASGLQINVEAMFVYSPIENFGLMIGPVIDFGLSGKVDVKNTPASSTPEPERSFKEMNFGLASGIVGYF